MSLLCKLNMSSGPSAVAKAAGAAALSGSANAAPLVATPNFTNAFFDSIDTDKTGFVEFHELKGALTAGGVSSSAAVSGVGMAT